MLSGNSLRKTAHTHCASVHQAAKLVAVLLRVAGVTAGLAESNGSLPPGLWLALPAGWLPRTGISSGKLHSEAEYGLPFFYFIQMGIPLSPPQHTASFCDTTNVTKNCNHFPFWTVPRILHYILPTKLDSHVTDKLQSPILHFICRQTVFKIHSSHSLTNIWKPECYMCRFFLCMNTHVSNPALDSKAPIHWYALYDMYSKKPTILSKFYTSV